MKGCGRIYYKIVYKYSYAAKIPIKKIATKCGSSSGSIIRSKNYCTECENRFNSKYKAKHLTPDVVNRLRKSLSKMSDKCYLNPEEILRKQTNEVMTMHKIYGEPNDEYGKHICCKQCGFCVTCGDCKKYGCGDEVGNKEKKRWGIFGNGS